MSASDRYDLIVVGLGAVGSAALYHAATRGMRVLGIDRHDPPHTFGSSHAESRLTRLAVGEGPQYLPFVARSHEIWRELEALTGVQLLHQGGGYIITPPAPTDDDRWGGFVSRTAQVAAGAGIEFDVRTPDQLRDHVPSIILHGSEQVGYEPTAGIVLCERAVAAQLHVARARGATVLTNQTVTSVEPVADGAAVSVGSDVYRGDSVIVSTGAWFAELAPEPQAAAVEVTRQVVFWLEVDDPESYSAEHFPFLIWAGQTINDYLAVFPMPSNGVGALKVLGEQFHQTTTAETVDRTVTNAELDEFYERLVIPRIRGVSRRCVERAVCLYTNTVDDHFLIERHRKSDRVIYASPCSGHGFKHSTALAETMVEELSSGRSSRDLTPFARTH